MENKYYCLKARTAWTFAHWFQDENHWDDSLKVDGVPPLALIKEYDKLHLQIESDGGTSNLGTTGQVTSHCQSLDMLGELSTGASTEEWQDVNDGAGGPSTSKDDQISSSQNSKLSPTALQRKHHACDVCEKTFCVPSELLIHLRVHSGDKPFHCTQCDKSFAQKSGLQRHLAVHTGAKPYSCTQCSYSCLQKSHLISHLHTHTDELPYTCNVCRKSFRQSSALQQHLLTHTKEKPHKCEHCGKCFSLKGHLTAHTRTHTGETPYSCQTCGKSFAQSNNRNRHSRRCTSIITSDIIPSY